MSFYFIAVVGICRGYWKFLVQPSSNTWNIYGWILPRRPRVREGRTSWDLALIALEANCVACALNKDCSGLWNSHSFKFRKWENYEIFVLHHLVRNQGINLFLLIYIKSISATECGSYEATMCTAIHKCPISPDSFLLSSFITVTKWNRCFQALIAS